MAGEIENLDLDQYSVANIYYSGESDSDSENEEIVAKRGQLYLGCDILNSTMLQCTL